MPKSYRICKEADKNIEAVIHDFYYTIRDTRNTLGIYANGELNPSVFEEEKVLYSVNCLLGRNCQFYLLLNEQQKDVGLVKLALNSDKVKRASFLSERKLTSHMLVTDDVVLMQDGNSRIFPDFNKDVLVFKENTKFASSIWEHIEDMYQHLTRKNNRLVLTR